VTFRSGKSSEESHIIKHADVESRFAGWISCFVDDPSHNFVKIEVKGPDNSLR
jgi:E3 ubiquitin-protein ligase MYCBP2